MMDSGARSDGIECEEGDTKCFHCRTTALAPPVWSKKCIFRQASSLPSTRPSFPPTAVHSEDSVVKHKPHAWAAYSCVRGVSIRARRLTPQEMKTSDPTQDCETRPGSKIEHRSVAGIGCPASCFPVTSARLHHQAADE